MVNRHVKSDENKKILYIDAYSIYGHSISQTLPYYEINFDRNFIFEDILKTPDVSDIWYSVEVDLKYPDEKKHKTKNFPFGPLNKISHQEINFVNT